MTAMTEPACRPLSTLARAAGPQRPDRLAELLECVGDLLVETRRQRLTIGEHCESDDLGSRPA